MMRAWARIEIGGDLPRASAAALLPLFEVSSEFDLMKYIEDETLVLEDDEVTDGEFTELEELCAELGLPYVRYSDALQGAPPGIVFRTPETGCVGAVETRATDSHMPVMEMSIAAAALSLLRQGENGRARALLEREVVEVPELPPFRLV